MKIEIGMYVRYKRGSMGYGIDPADKIGKVINQINGSDIYELDNNNNIFENDVTKASYNIIDILEVGDYVNESIVLGFENKYIEEDDKFVPIGVITENCYLDNNKSWIIEKDIKTIVTKEEFKLMTYKVGE